MEDIYEKVIRLEFDCDAALWESGGGYTNTGSAQIIAGPEGEPLRPLKIAERGHLACGEHALFRVDLSMLIVRANHRRGDFEVTVSRIIGFKVSDETELLTHAQVKVLHILSEGKWDKNPPQKLHAAIEAAKKKALCWHCRSPHYGVGLPKHKTIRIKESTESIAILEALHIIDRFSDKDAAKKCKERWINEKILPFIVKKTRNRPQDTREWCDYFGVSIDDVQLFKYERQRGRVQS